MQTQSIGWRHTGQATRWLRRSNAWELSLSGRKHQSGCGTAMSCSPHLLDLQQRRLGQCTRPCGASPATKRSELAIRAGRDPDDRFTAGCLAGQPARTDHEATARGLRRAAGLQRLLPLAPEASMHGVWHTAAIGSGPTRPDGDRSTMSSRLSVRGVAAPTLRRLPKSAGSARWRRVRPR